MSPWKHLSMLAVRIYLLCLIGVAADLVATLLMAHPLGTLTANTYNCC
jgi:hypothetical protein